MTIYSIGDSHAWHAWLKIPNIIVRTIGPMTMYRVGRDKPILTTGIPLDAIVCFSWGEIDCRCHIHKYQPWQKTINVLVEHYLKAIELNVANRNPKLVWLYNVVPPIRHEYAIVSDSFPFIGTDYERLIYVKYLNKKLEESKYTFIDLSKEYGDEEGFLRTEISDKHVHVENDIYLQEWIRINGSLHSQSNLILGGRK